MARKKVIYQRELVPDPRYNEVLVSKFINYILRRGKKSLAEAIIYGALDRIEKGQKGEAIRVFKKAIDNAKPLLEVKSRRVGGATYQVPVEVKDKRRVALAIRWLTEAAKARGEKTMEERLAAELLEAATGRGGAIKKKDDVHRMAEANKAFAHYRW